MPEMTFEYALKQNGINPRKDLNIDTSIAFAAMGGAFISGQGDFVTLFEPTASQVVSMNKGYIVSSLGEESGEIPYTCYSSLKSYMNENEDILRRFTNAIYKALDFVHNSTSNEIAKIISKQFETNTIQEIETVVERYKSIDAWPSSLELKEEGLNKLMDIMELAGELDKRAPYDKIVTNIYA